MPAPKLDWATAQVKDATLTVELDGDLPSGWKQGFATTVRLLAAGEWGEVAIKKQTVHVQNLTEGQEERLRHFLDSVVMQANASHPGKSERSEADAEAEAEAEPDDAEGPDAEMTKRFQAFAGNDPAREPDSGPESGPKNHG